MTKHNQFSNMMWVTINNKLEARAAGILESGMFSFIYKQTLTPIRPLIFSNVGNQVWKEIENA